jgi:hypothetical protein
MEAIIMINRATQNWPDDMCHVITEGEPMSAEWQVHHRTDREVVVSALRFISWFMAGAAALVVVFTIYR